MKLGKLLFLLSLAFSTGAFAQARKASVADTPPMGWNSYNCFGSAVHEDEVKANADYMAKNLKLVGWQYIVVDFLWSYDNPPGSNIGNPFQKNLQDGSFVPWLTMDQWGRLMPQPNKFPSAFGGRGFSSLAAYVHKLGLKFGIHVMRGYSTAGCLGQITCKGHQWHNRRYGCRYQLQVRLDEPHVRPGYEKTGRTGIPEFHFGIVCFVGRRFY